MNKRIKYTYKGGIWRSVCPGCGSALWLARIEWCHDWTVYHYNNCKGKTDDDK